MPGVVSKVGPYTIEREIGRGGMGVVDLATDSRLGRKVAIKALPEHLAADPDRLARFEREARTLASLNHPNVAGIHGIEEQNGLKHLILEYVEGETLQERLERGALPVDDAIDVCAQIAAGLEAAHDAGIVHRDLKPGNVKITPEGKVKVLDFGLAKTGEGVASSSSQHAVVTDSPTITGRAPIHSPTIPGAIMGTAPYMSPEQARGRAVDKRSDIWSFGVVLYECLTGLSPFAGETASESIGAVLHVNPDLNLLPPGTPPRVRRVLTHCLEKDKSKRWRDAGDVRIELASEEDGQAGGGAGAIVSGRAWLVVAGVALLLGVVGLLAGRRLAPEPAPEPAHVLADIKLSNIAAAANALDGMFEMSPVTREIAYIGEGPDESDGEPVRRVHVLDLATGRTRALAGTEGAGKLSYSPDGSQIAFTWWGRMRDETEIRRVPSAGGPALTVLEDPEGGRWSVVAWAPCWLSDRELAVFAANGTTLHRVSIADGSTALIGECDPENRAATFAEVRALPGGRGALVTSMGFAPGGQRADTVHRLDLASGAITPILTDAGFARFVPPDRLAFVRNKTLCVAPFDPATCKVGSPVTPLVSSIRGGAVFFLSARGDLLYVEGETAEARRRIVAVDREGKKERLVAPEMAFGGSVEFSPDGSRLAVEVQGIEGPPRIRLIDARSGFVRELPDKSEVQFGARWLSDDRLGYSATSNLRGVVLETINPDTESEGTPLYEQTGQDSGAFGPVATPDGSLVVFTRWSRNESTGGWDSGVYGLERREGAEPFPIVATDAEEGDPRLSPDGKWLVYSAEVSERRQVFVRAFDAANPRAGARAYSVSVEGGDAPFWSAAGDEIFFVGRLPRRDLMSVAFETDPAVRLSEPRVVLTGEQMGWTARGGEQSVSLHPDGRRFVTIEDVGEEAGTPEAVRLVLNWGEEARRATGK